MGDPYVEVPNADGHGNQAQPLNVDAPAKSKDFTNAGADGFDRSSMVYHGSLSEVFESATIDTVFGKCIHGLLKCTRKTWRRCQSQLGEKN